MPHLAFITALSMIVFRSASTERRINSFKEGLRGDFLHGPRWHLKHFGQTGGQLYSVFILHSFPPHLPAELPTTRLHPGWFQSAE